MRSLDIVPPGQRIAAKLEDSSISVAAEVSDAIDLCSRLLKLLPPRGPGHRQIQTLLASMRYNVDRREELVNEVVVPAILQSEVLAKFFEEIGGKCGEILAKFFADFRPSISRENGRKKFHEKSSTFSTVHQIKFFHCCNSGGLGAQKL